LKQQVAKVTSIA